MQQNGQVPEAGWLTGDSIGWQGASRQAMRPPMPTPSPRAMSDGDPRAICRYVRSLGAKGQPAYMPPGGKATTPCFDFTPRNLATGP